MSSTTTGDRPVHWTREVHLTNGELTLACWEADRRRLVYEAALAHDRFEHVSDDEAFKTGAVAVMGEIGFARLANFYWQPSGGPQRGGADVGGWEVRTVTEPHKRLLVYESAPDDRPHALVQVKARTVTVIGWLRASEAKRPEWREKSLHGTPFAPPRTKLRALPDDLRSVSVGR